MPGAVHLQEYSISCRPRPTRDGYLQYSIFCITCFFYNQSRENISEQGESISDLFIFVKEIMKNINDLCDILPSHIKLKIAYRYVLDSLQTSNRAKCQACRISRRGYLNPVNTLHFSQRYYGPLIDITVSWTGLFQE